VGHKFCLRSGAATVCRVHVVVCSKDGSDWYLSR